MLKGLIGGITRGLGKMGGETMEAAPRAAEKIASVPISLAEKPTITPTLMKNTLSIESKAQKGGPGIARSGLREISDGNLTKEDASSNNPDEVAQQDLNKREFTDPLAGLPVPPTQPSYPGEGFNVVSKTLEEIPEAIGGSPKDVVVQAPQGR